MAATCLLMLLRLLNRNEHAHSAGESFRSRQGFVCFNDRKEPRSVAVIFESQSVPAFPLCCDMDNIRHNQLSVVGDGSGGISSVISGRRGEHSPVAIYEISSCSGHSINESVKSTAINVPSASVDVIDLSILSKIKSPICFPFARIKENAVPSFSTFKRRNFVIDGTGCCV